jgi:transposase-like protein/DDE family transposase
MPRRKKIEPVSSEFEGAQLGDERLTRRLMRIADAVSAAPTRSFPAVTGSDSELEGVYRFMSNSRVSSRKILAPHFAASAERAGKGDVLVVHDTTNFVFGGLVKRQGLGRFKQGQGQGFFGHFALAVTADGSRQPLGLVGLCTIVRHTPPHRQARLSGTSWEFSRWANLALHVNEALPRAIHVMDREADAITLFNELGAAGARFVVRSHHNRRLGKDDESGETHLNDALERGKVMLRRTVPLSRRRPDPLGRALRKIYPPRMERLADLRVKASRVTVKSPPYGHLDPDYPREVTLNAVLVEETTRKAGLDPVCWRLLTNLPVDTPEEVAFVVDAYRTRWMIEEFFKALKTGCAIEKRQLETGRALLNALAVFAVVAWRLLLLRHVARTSPDAPATAALTSQQVRVLSQLAAMTGPNVPKVDLPPNPSAADALRAVAQLGGHIKNNGPPGWQVLGRGYDSLLLVELGWMARGARM